MALIQTVVKGDFIIERNASGKKKLVPVKKVELHACSKPSVHINGSDCYDWGTHVEIAIGEETLGDLKEQLDEEIDDPGVLV